jgi:hypothetical protein
VVPPNAEAWSLEASFAVAKCDGEIRIPRATLQLRAHLVAENFFTETADALQGASR